MKISHILEGIKKDDATHHAAAWTDEDYDDIYLIIDKHNSKMDMGQVNHEADLLSDNTERRTRGAFEAGFIRLYAALTGKVPTGEIKSKNWFTDEGATKSIEYAVRVGGVANAKENYKAAVHEFNVRYDQQRTEKAEAKSQRVNKVAMQRAAKQWDQAWGVAAINYDKNDPIIQRIHAARNEMIKTMVERPHIAARSVLDAWIHKNASKQVGESVSFASFMKSD